MPPQTVLVTGASGQTGALVVSELLKQPDQYSVRAVVRSDKARQLMLELGVSPDNVFTADLAGASSPLKVALHGCDALVVCTSAVPVVRVLPTLLGGVAAWVRSKVSRSDAVPFVPVADWKGGQTPYEVDFLGQVAQVDAAKAAGVGHIVLVSSAGGCDPRHFLNHIGSGEVSGRRGNILNHKRAAEQHLIASGVPYTILHPNHLNDDSAGSYQLVLGVDDELQQPHWRQRLKMPRSLLAQLCVHCLALADDGAANRSIDCAGRRVADAAQATTSVEQVRQLLAAAGNCTYEGRNDRTQAGAVFATEGADGGS